MPYSRIEKSSCAVGAVINHHNKSKKTNIKLVLEALAKLPHRGGQIFKKYKDETVQVGDGAGVRCSIDWKFYNTIIQEFDIKKDAEKPCAIGNFFMPVDEEMRRICAKKIQEICKEKGIEILQNGKGESWRDIPFESKDSEVAKELKLQKFQQCFFSPKTKDEVKDFEKTLLEIYREIEKYSTQLDKDEVAAGKPPAKLAVASISDKEVIYKGMLLPHEVACFKDLQESNPAEVFYHIRQSTNVSPTPGNAQPFSHIAHNGEFNSIDGNNYKAHKPSRGFSDSRSFDDHVRDLLIEGYPIAQILTMLMPPPLTGDAATDAMILDMKIRGFEYNGPAHIVFSHNGVKGAVLDSNALRPSRYLITQDQDGNKGLYIGSEDMLSQENLQEMLPQENLQEMGLGLRVVERGMLKAGEMILMEGNIVKKHPQILAGLKASYQPTEIAISEIQLTKLTELPQKQDFGVEELEVRKYQLLPLLDGHAKKMAMGDDTPPLDSGKFKKESSYFKQKFSQVSSPPVDSRAEQDTFDLTTYLGKKNHHSSLIKLKSPLLQLGEFEAMKLQTADTSHSFDLAFDLSQESDSEADLLEAMQKMIRQTCVQAEAQVRAGKSIIILDFSNISKTKIALPEILVTGAVYSHLHKHGLEKNASIVVNSTQMDSAHHFSTLSALGATAVNPAFAYNFALDLAKGNAETYTEKCHNFHQAIGEAHMLTMAKYGITSADVYHASRLVESITLNLEEKAGGDSDDPSVLSCAFNNVQYEKEFDGKFGVKDLLKDAVVNHHNLYQEQNFTAGRYAYKVDGVAHSYNPTVVRAVRNATTEYRTRRDLREEYLENADFLQGKLGEIGEEFNFEEYKTKTLAEKKALEGSLKTLNEDLARANNKNEKLLNSLFFLDGIAQELDKISEAQKKKPATPDMEDLVADASKSRAEGFSLNEVSIRQFLLVVEDSEFKESVVASFKKYKSGQLSLDNFKDILFAKAGFDQSQRAQIEQWGQLTKDGKSDEAADLFQNLNEKNQRRISDIYSEYNKNKSKIDELENLKRTQTEAQAKTNFLSAILTKSDDAASYQENLKTQIKSLTAKAQENDLLPKITDQKFDQEVMDKRPVDSVFEASLAEIIANKKQSPVSIADHLSLKTASFKPLPEAEKESLQKVSDIAGNVFVTGGMSYGALTLSAHNDVAKSAQLLGGKACTGEGGKPDGQIATVVQVASGRFGLNPEYFKDAQIIEIKIGQGAKPGQGGLMPGEKVTVEIAAKRNSLVGEALTSPPSHHDIYSIEDLQQLIHDLKELKPGVKVAVKISSSTGVGEIAKGLAKSGCDIINITGGSGGTGAAEVDSIKNTGLPSEIGLALVNQSLLEAGIRDLVQLQVSGFPFTPEGVITMAILGGDIFESGTFDLMLLGCDMHRKCNVPGACGPGITNNEKGYQGHGEDLALYKLNMARAVQDLLGKIGVTNLKDLRGRTDLLSAELLHGKVSEEFIARLMNRNQHDELKVDAESLEQYRQTANKGTNDAQYSSLLEAGFVEAVNQADKTATFNVGQLDVTNRTFGATLAFKHYQELATGALDRITIKTSGNVGQSYGAFNAHGLCLEHSGVIQDGFGKSMSGGVLVVKQPPAELALTDSIYVGNAALYGANSGKAFIPSAGSRFAILMKGATAVVNGNVGDRACSYMTSGSVLILGNVGKNFGTKMIGGIAVCFDMQKDLSQDPDIRYASADEAKNYHEAIKKLLEEDFVRTKSPKAQQILANFESEKSKFQIIIPKTLDKIKTLQQLEKNESAVFSRYSSKKFGAKNTISPFEECWFDAKRKELEQQKEASEAESAKLNPAEERAKEISEDLHEAAKDHSDKMRRYGPLATRIVGGLGVPDQVLSDYVGELMAELFDHGKKCSCDAVTCTKSEQKTKEDKHTSSGCPLGKNPNLINAILKDTSLSEEQRARKAFAMQIKESPFAGFTGLACPAPCQDSCTHSASDSGNDEAVKIKRIELLLHRIALKKGWYDELQTFSVQKPTVKDAKVMIIGSGPSALEAAYHLALNGVAVEIFEKSDKIGGLLRYGIPDHKLQKETIDFYVEKLKAMGVKFFTNREIDISKIDPKNPEYNLYIDARGVTGNPIAFDERFTKTQPEKGQSMAMDFLSYCNEFHQAVLDGNPINHPFVAFNLGKTTVVIGSGDTAEDVKRSIIKLNSHLAKDQQVKLIAISRNPELSTEVAAKGSDFPHSREKASGDLQTAMLHEAQPELAQTLHETSPQEFNLDEEGKITGVKVGKTYVVEQNFAKKYRSKPVELETYNIHCDSAITAIGYKAPEINPHTVADLSQVKNQAIVSIGDIATKTGRAPGSELIVNAQTIGKTVAINYVNSVANEYVNSNKAPSPSAAAVGNFQDQYTRLVGEGISIGATNC